MSATLDETPDRHAWTLAGHRVTQLAVDLGSARLLAWSLQSSMEIRLGVPFTVRLADGTARTVDPEAPEQLAPLLTLVGRAIERLVVTREGALSVLFGDGTTIEAGPHPRHESFEVQGGGALEGLTYRGEPGARALW